MRRIATARRSCWRQSACSIRGCAISLIVSLSKDADAGYAGKKLKAAVVPLGRWTVQIIPRSDAANGFELLPRRWVVERAFAWLGRNRCPAKDVAATMKSAKAWLAMASVQMITRRIART